jgi:hypothetical protein
MLLPTQRADRRDASRDLFLPKHAPIKFLAMPAFPEGRNFVAIPAWQDAGLSATMGRGLVVGPKREGLVSTELHQTKFGGGPYGARAWYQDTFRRIL